MTSRRESRITRLTPVLLFFVLFSTSLLHPVAHATTFVPIPLTAQVGDSDTILRGKIGSSYADYGPRNDGGKSIYTFYHLQVTEVVKGDVAPSSSVMIREMGGEVGGLGMQVAGSAHFDAGEDVVVFLGPKNPDGSYDLKGLSSGKYNIQTQDDGTEKLIGLAKNETMSSLRRIARQRRPKPSPSLSSSPSLTPSKVMPESHSAAPQLQPSSPPPLDEEGKPSAKTSVWVFILAVGLLGWFALQRFLKR